VEEVQLSDFSILPATSDETEAIRALLIQAELPGEDFTQHLNHFLTAKQNSTLAGAVGLEIYDELGLLRSLVVEASYRGQGLGKKLCEQIFAYAQSQGVKKLYLLTTTAANFFPKLDFSPIDRDSVPPAIRATEEFASICPSTAICMVKML
jgi:amino-acid N-acetyltransferase